MTIPPPASETCRKALEKVAKAAEAAKGTRDADAALHALNAVWFAIQDAQTVLIAARAEAKVSAWVASMEVHA